MTIFNTRVGRTTILGIIVDSISPGPRPIENRIKMYGPMDGSLDQKTIDLKTISRAKAGGKTINQIGRLIVTVGLSGSAHHFHSIGKIKMRNGFLGPEQRKIMLGERLAATGIGTAGAVLHIGLSVNISYRADRNRLLRPAFTNFDKSMSGNAIDKN